VSRTAAGTSGARAPFPKVGKGPQGKAVRREAIVEAARMVLEDHGRTAFKVASEAADYFERCDMPAAARTWRAIATAVRELQRGD
jgi:hypothetical protein